MANPKATYVLPQDVRSPRRTLVLLDILIEGQGEREASYALQFWRDYEVYSIGYRWNGDAEKPNSTPNISGHACWIVLDERMWPAVLAAVSNPAKRANAAGLLYGPHQPIDKLQELISDTADTAGFEAANESE